MKLNIGVFLILALFLVGQSCGTTSDLPKDEYQEWKRIAQEYKKNPAALKALTEDVEDCREEAQELQSRVNNMESKYNQDLRRVAQLEQENMQLRDQLSSAEATIRRLQASPVEPTPPGPQPPTGGDDYTQGVVYRVQVGAFSRDRIPEKFRNMPDMMVEDAGNLQKVLVGNYRNYEAAKQRQSELKAQGIEGPFVVAYRNGVRVSLQDVRGN